MNDSPRAEDRERRERSLEQLMARRDARLGPFAEDPEWTSPIPF